MGGNKSTIGALLDETGGSIKTGPFGTKLKASEYTATGVPVISVGEVGFGRLRVHHDTPRVDETVSSRMPEFLLKAGDIVFGRKGAVERSAQVQPDEDGYFLGSDGIRIRLNVDECDPKFISYQLQTTAHRSWMIQHAAGTTMPSLNEDIIRRIPIILKPLAEQKAIAGVLGALDDKIELNRRMNGTLEAMARALFQSWFVDFDPVRRNMDRTQRHGDTEGTSRSHDLRGSVPPCESFDSLFPDSFQDSELGHIPKGWKVVGLPEAIDFLEGPGLRNWQYRDEGMKFLNIRCIGEGDLDIAKANCISLEEFEKTYSHFALCVDDIVISTSGTLGRLAIVRPDHLPVMLNTSIIRMRGIGAVGLGYVWGFLQSEYFLSEMFALAAGSVQLNFGPMHLRQISMLRPPDGILEGFEKEVQPLLKKSLHLRKESRILATLRDTLLPKLLSGELSVADFVNIIQTAP